MKELIKRLIFAWRYKRAVRKADELHRQNKRKYFVIVLDGKPRAVAKQTIRHLIRTRRFKKGVTAESIEKRALYVTL